MSLTKYIANLFLIIVTIVFVSFFYQGVITKSPVSLDYNIPIAESIASGEFIHIHSTNPYLYFPGSSHFFLALFLILGLPINLFGVLSWIVLGILCKKLADTVGLTNYMSIIFSASFCMTMSVLRTIGDQSIDKWLCSWFVLSILLLEKPERSWKFSLLVGLSLGMLIGTKYSGPLFLIALLCVYGIRLIRFSSPMRFIGTSILFTATGLFWYIRNLILEGSPYYPANLHFFKGYPHFEQQDWMLWKVLINYPQGNLDLLNAFLSEYMIWAFSGVVAIVFVIYWMKKKQTIDGRIMRLTLLGIALGIVSLLLPITTPYKIELFHIISDMRYIYIVVVVFMLVVFLLADRYKKNVPLGTLAIINTLPVFSFIPYLPKIYLFCILFFILIYFKESSIVQKICRF